ncbi:MAG: hypothetical protein AAFU60_04255 [Bacteroidota bacterium]
MIKRSLLWAFVALLTLPGCQDESGATGSEEQGTPAAQENTTTPRNTGSAETAAYPVIGGENGVISEQTSKVLRILSTNFWITEAYVKIREPEAHAANRGIWYKFEKDGRFTSGRWLESTGTGTWTYDPQNLLLHIDSTNDEEDQEYKMQISSDEQIMIWIGTERYAISGVQRKMVNNTDLIADLPK